MNILPKKRWHVRNRENIARVRKDELAAENEEKEKERRRRIAEQEAKLQILRSESKRKNVSPPPPPSPSSSREESKKCPRHEHVNFFESVETCTTNKEREREMTEEKEKYEKQIGYLTYLGQNTNEAEGRVSWYNKPRNELNHFVAEADKKDEKSKSMLDPLKKIESILRKKSTSTECKNVQRNLKSDKKPAEAGKSRDKKTQLALLREKRLKREKEEKMRIEKLLSSMRSGERESAPTDSEADKSDKKFSRRYNSQFNPHLARQNYCE